MRIIWRIIDFLLPTRCSYCRSRLQGSSYPFICSACWSDFSILTPPICPRCGRPFESPVALEWSPAHECSGCRLDPPAFDQSLSIGQFEGPLREAVHVFKYRPCRSLGRPLGTWMATNVRPISGMDIVIPVPLHKSRLRQRGFNQALLLADVVARLHSIPLSYDNLQRIRPTRPQVELSKEERIKNVVGAFDLRRPLDVVGKKVLLVDDVFTTGATMNECASILKQAGAEFVACLTIARSI